MRLLQVFHGWPPAQQGGTELYGAALVEAQRAAGQQVHVFVGGRDAPPGRGIRDAAVEAVFEQTLRRLRPDLVHFHHLTGLSMGLPMLTKKHDIPVVFSLHDYWLECARGQRVDRWGRRCGGPTTAACAACVAPVLPPVDWWKAEKMPGRLSALLSRPWRRPMAQRQAIFREMPVDCWISPSAHLGRTLGLPAIWLPLPLFGEMPTIPQRKPGPLRMIFAGSLLPTKGVHLVLEAFARVRPGSAVLRIVGSAVPFDGRMRYADTLLVRARALGVRVEAVAHREMGALLAEQDLLLFPSLWQENSPSILREAAALGLRVLATAGEAVEELVPSAVRVKPTVEDWKMALEEEIERGPMQEEPRSFPTMAEHRLALQGCYERVMRKKGQTLSFGETARRSSD